jgi:hypothetical protein
MSADLVLPRVDKVRRPWSVVDVMELIDEQATLLAIIVADAAKAGAMSQEAKAKALRATGLLTYVAGVLRAR